jgi:hypothetical protein
MEAAKLSFAAAADRSVTNYVELSYRRHDEE